MAEEQNNEQQQDKTYTQADIDALTTAKNKERDAANAANAEVRELKKQILELQSKTYGDEDKIKASPLYRNLENELKKQSEEILTITASLKLAQEKIDDGELAKELSKNETLLPTAVEDVITQLKTHGFSKTEKGWLSKDGESVNDFIKTLQSSKPHYFKRTVGSRQQLYTNEKLQNMSRSDKDPHKMLTDIFSN